MIQKGFTLIEVLVVMAILSLLLVLLLPQITVTIEDAERLKAQADCRNIATAVFIFRRHIGSYPFFTHGHEKGKEKKANVVTLRGEGELPTEDVTSAWTSDDPSDDDITVTNPTWDSLKNQLVINEPAYETTGIHAWKGPYILKMPPDPWGNAYLLNVANLISNSHNVAFCLSAGPNGEVETDFDIDYDDDFVPGGDDIVYRIR